MRPFLANQPVKGDDAADESPDMEAAKLAPCHGVRVGAHDGQTNITFTNAVQSVLQSLSQRTPVYQANGLIGDDVQRSPTLNCDI